ncbi:MAG: SRPBCC family protein [Actinomycetota bacterium]|nr:SRPBCC family protein [Actinomycetota bacterium]
MAISGSASADIDASIDAVWAAVEDVGTWAEWQDTLGTVRPLEQDADGRVSRCKLEIDAKVTTIKVELSLSYDEPQRVSWHREGGDLKGMDGAWLLEDLGDGRTRVAYELEVDPGRVIGLFLNAEREANLRQTLVDVRPDELKARVEGS